MSKSGSIMAILITAMMLTVLLPFDVAGANYGMDTSASKASASFDGAFVNKNLGFAEIASSKGDVNGDGYADLLISGYQLNNGSANWAGKAYLIFGHKTGWAMGTPIAEADVTFTGEAAGHEAGFSASIAGDVNGDGYDDILISALSGGVGSRGRTYLVFGQASGWLPVYYLYNATASFDGESLSDQAGYAVGGVGDVNGDGYDDFYIGTVERDIPMTNCGRVYLILGKPTGWTKATSLATADASFYGPKNSQAGGFQVGAGDINGDGLDDLAIGAQQYNQSTGIVYLIFGKKTGWANNVNLSTSADASIVGERLASWFGYGVSLDGDLNGDGFDDVVIGAGYDDEAFTNAGQVYVVFGKAAGWKKYFNASGADATFLGEAAQDLAGYGFTAGGDVNGDGIDDMFIGAQQNSESGVNAGQAYVILGKKTGWTKDTSLTLSDASFLGEGNANYFGIPSLITGDLNGDGFDDLSASGSGAMVGGIKAGKEYVIFFDTNKPPTPITSVKAYAKSDYTYETAYAMPGDTIYLELKGTDGNASRKDVAVVKLKSQSAPVGYTIRLYETALNSGVYRSSYVIKQMTDKDSNWVKGLPGDTITAQSFTDPAKMADVAVAGPMELMPKADDLTALEDALYNVHYYATNVTTMDGIFETDATWLEMNGTTQNLSGTPDNSLVGSYWVRLNVTDGFGRTDEHNFTVVVANTPPVIETVDNGTATEDVPYAVDYNSTDDGQGTVTWSMETDADAWLVLNGTTGNLTGTPINVDVGSYYVNITVDDGNGGTDFSNFTLAVANVNDGPGITTNDVGTATEDVLYSVDYNATDVDAGDVLTWSLKTSAGAWLKMNATSGVLSGTPANDDVGSYYVNVTVKDQGLLSDFHNFTLPVANVNDPPVWKNVPPAEVKVNSLQVYTFDVNATDIDKGDKLVYGVVITPTTTKVTINATTGVISIGPLDKGIYSVNLSCTDSVARINSIFKLNVTHKNSAPTAVLVGPVSGTTVATAKPTLTWTTADKDADKVTVDVYFSNTEANVNNKAAAAKVLSASAAKTYTPTAYLTPGTKYYWTVIPFDGNDTGACLNGTFNFTVSASAKVNHAPTISPPAKVPDATTGKDYKLTVTGTDQDTGTTFTYTLTGAPAGMSISNAGLITWKPTKDQAKTGTFTFSVVVSDGEFSANTPVTVKVKKAADTGLGAMMVPILLILIIVIIIIVLLAVSMRKKPTDKDEDEEDEEEEKVAGEEE